MKTLLFMLMLCSVCLCTIVKQDDKPVKKSETKALRGLKKMRRRKRKEKKVKRNPNPLDCYLTMQALPIEFFVEAERLLMRLRFHSNCLHVRDIVMITIADIKRSLSQWQQGRLLMNLKILNTTYQLTFDGLVKDKKPGMFEKWRYEMAHITTDYYDGGISLISENNLLLVPRLSTFQMTRYINFKSPAYCEYLKNDIMSCSVFTD